MLNSITIKRFRCFDEFSFAPTAKVNLITGKNSVGKTALLEALYLLIGAENLGLVIKLSQFRGMQSLKGEIKSVLELLWAPLFHNLDVTATIEISGTLSKGGEHKVKINLAPADAQMLYLDDLIVGSGEITTEDLSRQSLIQTFTDPNGYESSFEMKWDIEQGQLALRPVPPSPPFPGYFDTARRILAQEEEANLYGNLVKSKQPYDLVPVLRVIEDRLEKIASIQVAGTPMIYGDIGLNQMLPVSLLGDGMARMLGILLRIANSSNGVVLIDEIENGLHYSILLDMWRAIHKAANLFNTQIFATTHSYDCIKAAHTAFSETLDYDFRLHRLDRIRDKIKATTYDKEALSAAIKTDFEVR